MESEEAFIGRITELVSEMAQLLMSRVELIGEDDRQSADDPAWRSFLEDHPELEVALTEDLVLEALAASVAESADGAVFSDVLAADIYGVGDFVREPGLVRSRTSRVADRLRRLADQGRVVRLRPTYGRGANLWTTPGTPITGWAAKYRRPD